ncbi:MAG: ribbon-helix-helix protein, CopG family [Sphingobacteriia bacterium]|nr:ribbon-helix-helix protein, CopG family [Sphingobacteriia bacterium]
MSNNSISLPEHLQTRLDHLCAEIDRNKSYIVQQALEAYLDEKEDLLISLSRLAKPGKKYSMEEVEKDLGLED